MYRITKYFYDSDGCYAYQLERKYWIGWWPIAHALDRHEHVYNGWATHYGIEIPK